MFLSPSLVTTKKYYVIQLLIIIYYSSIATTVKSFPSFLPRQIQMTPNSSIKTATAALPENNNDSIDINDDDPYLYLEEVESKESLEFARKANEHCLSTLGDPSKKKEGEGSASSSTYERILSVLESKDRIPYVTKLGVTSEKDDDEVYNFWKDENNTKGIWRKTTLSSYSTHDQQPEWETILDLDELSKQENISWVWKGYRPLHYNRDPTSTSKQTTRCLIYLSNGGADAITIREFDLISKQFLLVDDDEAFHVTKESKTRIAYKHRDLTIIGTELNDNDLTDSGYPRTVREWVRGTKLEDAPIVFEGESTDVSVGAFINDQRHRYGTIYEVRFRSMTFYTSINYVRSLSFEQLISSESKEEFVKLDVQEDAEIDFFGPYLFILLRSNWDINGTSYQKGSLLAVRYNSFMTKGKENVTFQVLFEPTNTTAMEYYRATKHYLILHTMDNVKSKLVFYKLDHSSSSEEDLVYIQPPLPEEEEDGAIMEIRDVSCSGIDATENDLVWVTVSGYTLPTTLYIGDISLIEQQQQNNLAATTSSSSCLTQKKLKSLPSLYNASGVVVEQQFAISKDGTSVPYFLIYDPTKNTAGKTPTLLYGYGGFEISMTPRYIATTGLSWIERGGAYVEANIRGGGEFGPSWHQSALRENRNKSFEDFAAVAQHLISTNVCSPSTLAIKGGSNGGLLVGNMYNMYPSLFAAIHCAVPLLDMKRYSILLAGASWMAEYGDPDIPSDWEFLQRYSPYHNIDTTTTTSTSFPKILFTTSTRDDRVHPAHARKMTSKLWDLKREGVYYYENMEGGHGGAANSKQSAFMTSLANDFLWNVVTSPAAQKDE